MHVLLVRLSGILRVLYYDSITVSYTRTLHILLHKAKASVTLRPEVRAKINARKCAPVSEVIFLHQLRMLQNSQHNFSEYAR